MNDPDENLESALRSLKPRAPGGHVVAALHREFNSTATRQSRFWFWRPATAWTLATAVCLVAAFSMYLVPTSTVPNYRLVGVAQSQPALDVFNPVQLEDGTYARPVRVHWNRSAQWEDSSTQTRLIHYQPEEKIALIPLEIF